MQDKYRILITEYQDKILSALWDGQRVLEFRAEPAAQEVLLQVGDIYIGRVSSVSKNIQAAFFEVSPGLNCFYQMSDGEKLRIGDERPVQITREAVKTKLAVCSTKISLAGRYMVLTDDRIQLSVSAKLARCERERLRTELAALPEEYGLGFIVRTNAGDCALDILRTEAADLAAQYLELKEIASHRPIYTRLRSGMPAYLSLLQSIAPEAVEEIVTDLPEIYAEIEAYQQAQLPSDRMPLRLYRDEQLSMTKLYRIEHLLEQALSRHVWLPSGGYLVIDVTEALTVIDVNTGKTDGHKKPQETFLRTNREAAAEIARQLRLRNLSGIILVDFIDLASKEKQQELYDYLQACLREDPVKCVLVDITALNLAEITRKKVRGTLWEQIHGKS